MVAEMARGATLQPATEPLCAFPESLPMRLRALFFATSADRLRPHSW